MPKKRSASRAATKGKRGRKAKSDALLPSEKVEIALEMFRPLAFGQPQLDYKQLKEHFDGVYKGFTPRMYKNIVEEVFRSQWLVVKRHMAAPSYIIDPDTSSQLRALLASRIPELGLQALIVVRGRDGHQEKEGVAARQAHMQVGIEMAKLLGTVTFGQKDSIALGSGRGVYYCLRALEREPTQKFQANDLSIVALTGSVFLAGTSTFSEDADEGPGVDLTLDADSFLPLLAQHFTRSKITLYAMHCGIAFGDASDRRAALENGGFFKMLQERIPQSDGGFEGWKKLAGAAQRERADRPPIVQPSTPNGVGQIRALMGVGVFGKGHRLYDSVTKPEAEWGADGRPVRKKFEDVEAAVRPIAKELSILATKVDEVARAYDEAGISPKFAAVFDLGNRLFVSDKPKEWPPGPDGKNGKAHFEREIGDGVSLDPLFDETLPDISKLARKSASRKSAPAKDAADKPAEGQGPAITDLCNIINSKMSAVPKRALYAAGAHVFLLGATEPKARPAIHLLQHFPTMIKVLVIDYAMAQGMISVLRNEIERVGRRPAGPGGENGKAKGR
jgi:hypothetical protein